MHNSKSDYGFRRTCLRPSENLETISEEKRSLMEPEVTPKKSATFHGINELRNIRLATTEVCSTPSSSSIVEYKEKIKRLHSQPAPPSSSSSCSRKRSIFYEMGERIRLFSTASFVSPAVVMPTSSNGTTTTTGERVSEDMTQRDQTVTGTNNLPKSHSLNSFDDLTAPVFVSARCPSGRSKSRRSEKNRPIGSLLSLHSQVAEMESDLEKGLEKDVSQLGILCHHCSTTDLACPKAQKELPSPSASSVYSLARSDLSNEPLCRICHCCWPPDSNDPLISPCRCSGSLQYVHVSCLMHWLDISSRKLHRPAICELCLYKYRRRRVLKYREMKLPQCANNDIRFYSIFVVAILMMLCSAFATIVCFQLEKNYGIQAATRNMIIAENEDIILSTPAAGPAVLSATVGSVDLVETMITSTVAALGVARKKTSDPVPLQTEFVRREDAENVLSTITLIAAMVFFLSFFLAMYAHVKSGLSFCGYISLCWSSNLEWSIEEYKHSRDTQYLNKLEELRRKINEKQKKAADEVEPLRSSVIVLE